MTAFTLFPAAIPLPTALTRPFSLLYRLSVFVLALLLAACASPGPQGLKIDRSVQAVGHNSRVKVVVLHYTSASTEQSLKILSQQQVSSHYLITDSPRPRVYQLVDENRRAWHAGISEWYGRPDINTVSIGIEIVNPGGADTAWAPYSQAQIDVLKLLLSDIIKRHGIDPDNIVGHSDIAPQRKVDPGPLFPWKQLADAGLARWYDEFKAARHLQEFQLSGLPDMASIQADLRRVGYTVPDTGVLDQQTRNVLKAFQMRYRPRLYDGMPDAETIAILKAL